jgi:endonuclease/exonuclease/phosphatase (EEP) superfamily protein YafD
VKRTDRRATAFIGAFHAPQEAMDSQSDTRRHLGRVALVTSLVALALIHPLATVLARFDWRADLLTHFTLPALVLTLVVAAALVRRHPRIALALGCLALWQGVPLWRYSGSNPVRAEERAAARLRLLMVNVLVENTRYADVTALIQRERPDVIGLIEVTPAWITALAEVRAAYPYGVESPAGTDGLVLWFRAPPERIDSPERPLPGGSSFIHAELRFAGRLRHLWLVHPTMPFVRKNLPELPALGALVGRTTGSRIVIGDLNTTEGSPWFADFVRATGLRDSRLGFGRQPSWPADLPYRITLEHALVSADLAVVARRLGPEIGSDHFPLILELAPAEGTLDSDAAREAEAEDKSSASHAGAASRPGRGG